MPSPSPSRRATVAEAIALDHGGVAHRAELRRHGVDRHAVRTEVRSRRWEVVGRHTVRVLSVPEAPAAAWWTAVWESGSGAVLDGAAALVAQGMTGFTPDLIDVSLPRASTRFDVPGVRPHVWRQLPPTIRAGVPRVRPEQALIHAAQWARTDRQAALVICLPVQQRLVRPAAVLAAWAEVTRSPRRAFVGHVIGDVCDGAHSLGELDFTTWCRRYRIPPPRRQVVRVLPSGRAYLDAEWEGLVVEIDGGHHLLGMNPLDDALRSNDVVIEGSRVLRLPVLGLRLEPERFMMQVKLAVERYVMPNASQMPRLA
ncbi:hypothetical protein [Knoellia sp. Soil729]|uniref:hypothetical protein n=1 Tax=Knoellia sp. Soil729 TaxID=1736394 RepID=UPI0006F2F4DF|nr:hypothetical protein [Knoellia sp. Soil729]KRE41876.1 hypothetical protein ASG74_05155 [Knoellia sp. Soil729]